MRPKRHEPVPLEDLDIPFGPPPEEYLYRCGICSEEMLVNEAIIDVAIGAAKFRGEYTGGMPIIGCPRCNGETMVYTRRDSYTRCPGPIAITHFHGLSVYQCCVARFSPPVRR